jgi:CRISPR/Cas system CSM-associated protein Csm3 (group 7 of RAMP superfamily)
MARRLSGRLRITGTLVARTPLHVGGHGEDVDTDLPLAKDGRGRHYVPGTSLAGPLRDWCRQMYPTLVQETWGFQKDAEGRASGVVVADAVVPEGAAVEVRDGVGIDRVWGCAADHIKYDRAILPCGTEIPLAISVELTEKRAGDVRNMFADLLAALQAGEVRFGAARTRGLGRLQLAAGFRVVEETLNTRDGLLAILSGTLPAVTLTPTGRRRPRLEIAIDWRPIGPLMVKSGLDGIGVDMLPLLSYHDGALSLVLPGSSVKGALRTQSERIVRTLLGKDADRKLEAKKRFLAHLRLPLIEDLFGSPGRSKASSDPGRDELGLGALGIDDCYATNVRIPPQAWENLIRAEPDAAPGGSESPLRRSLEGRDVNLPLWTASYHVAVDRWTGGAAEGFLYTVLEPHGVTWEALRLWLDPDRMRRLECEREALALLLFVLRDLSGGRIPLGFATHRGMGAVAVTGIAFTAVNCQPPLAALDGVRLAGGDLGGLPGELADTLTRYWQEWIRANRKDGSR